jgi:hypothetical protein
VRVHASRRAHKLIERQGGAVYVWFDGGLCASTDRPADRHFEEVSEGRFRLFADSALPDVSEIRFSRSPWPSSGLRVHGPKRDAQGFWRAVAIGERDDSSSGHAGT